MFIVDPQSLAKGKMPGFAGHVSTASTYWTGKERREKAAAVAVIFIPPKDSSSQYQIIFTKRSLEVGSHKGQIGFPGGLCEMEDRSPEETALRETFEEIGFCRSHLTAVGQLDSQLSVFGSPVIPVIFVSDLNLNISDFRINEDEVAEIILVSWEEFLDNKCKKFGFNLFGFWRESYHYLNEAASIWGLTAKILHSAKMREID